MSIIIFVYKMELMIPSLNIVEKIKNPTCVQHAKQNELTVHITVAQFL